MSSRSVRCLSTAYRCGHVEQGISFGWPPGPAVSAYRGRNSVEGGLSRFLALVSEGKVEKGSVLVIESLDRFSRENVVDVLPRFLDLLRAGITIVRLMDGQEYSIKRLAADWTPLIVSLTVMARAHKESRIKFERVAGAWKRKRERAAADGEVSTAKVPAWLTLEERDGQRRRPSSLHRDGNRPTSLR